jgi:PIN domain nuclease of toxin-antitoxin system
LGSSEVIVIDMHIWIWWVNQDARLGGLAQVVQKHETDGIGVSAISLWEVAMLASRRRILLDRPTGEWMNAALSYPGVRLVELTPAIAVDSANLPGEFHRDPADQMIVATARVLDCPLLTMDARILAYPHVRTAAS